MNLKIKNNNGGYISLVVLMIIVLGIIYFMSQTILKNKEAQQDALNRAATGESNDFNEPVTRNNSIGKAIDISTDFEQRANLINEEL